MTILSIAKITILGDNCLRKPFIFRFITFFNIKLYMIIYAYSLASFFKT